MLFDCPFLCPEIRERLCAIVKSRMAQKEPHRKPGREALDKRFRSHESLMLMFDKKSAE